MPRRLPGDYVLTARLGEWPAQPLALELKAPPAQTPASLAHHHRAVAEYLEALGRIEEALWEADAAVAAVPGDPDARLLRAQLLLALDRDAEAAALFGALLEEHTLQASGRDPPYALLRGLADAQRGLFE